MTQQEQDLRIQLAACYRIFDHLGWGELIFNHITVKIPGDEHHFLINPYGLHYSEVKASNLVKVDIEGKIIGESEYRVNPAGIVIHTAIHAARPDVHCIAHTHTTEGMAVACNPEGLRTDNFYSALLHNRIAYHDFEGITVEDDEKPRLINNLGDKRLAILRNHGLLTCGRSIPEAFVNLWTLQLRGASSHRRDWTRQHPCWRAHPQQGREADGQTVLRASCWRARVQCHGKTHRESRSVL